MTTYQKFTFSLLATLLFVALILLMPEPASTKEHLGRVLVYMSIGIAFALPWCASND